MSYAKAGDFDWSQPVTPRAVSAARRSRGRLAHLSGALAEDGVARLLEGRGMTVLARRWRGKAGEIDLICRDRECLIFVEVKQSATHHEAAQRLGAAQQGRIMRAALEYCDKEGHAPLPEMRFDAALVDGQGRIEILERAFEEAFA
ncbi:YraN family protein [Paracoccus shandongensis]|uniref:YraN family protein n=1 Tax=Paracoccus shandongensis TaxID=2816048 RepID=UPI001A900E97|nr:YraN family protein [Paracoccus shandongensis]